MARPLLEVQDLRVAFATAGGLVRAVDGISLQVAAGEALGVVGESGSGKSVTFAAVMGLVKPPGRIEGGCIRFDGRELTALSPAQWRALRGRSIAMTLQDAHTALNPALTVGTQLAEVLLAHAEDLPAERRARRAEVQRRMVEALRLVGIPDPAHRLGDYPHQFSGGMRQRVMIAIALSCRPRLLIADEPTTALDVTVQAQVLDLIGDLRETLGMSLVLITHDLAVVAGHCDRVAVMYAGQVVETGTTRAVIDTPLHPYTQGLLRSIPHPDREIMPIDGQVPELVGLGEQCRFAPRCAFARAECDAPAPLRPMPDGSAVRCVRAPDFA